MTLKNKILLTRIALITCGVLLFTAITCYGQESQEFKLNDFLLGFSGAGVVVFIIVLGLMFLDWLSSVFMKTGLVIRFTQDDINNWSYMVNYANYQNYPTLVSAFLKPLNHDEPLSMFYRCSKAVLYKDARYLELTLCSRKGTTEIFLLPIARIPKKYWDKNFSLVCSTIRAGFNSTQHFQRSE